MLEFWQDGKRVVIEAIYRNGKVGQTVILGTRVNWGESPDSIEFPLSQYPYPSLFTIVGKQEGKNGYYILADTNGKRIKLQDSYSGACESNLYDAQEWLTWNAMRERDSLSRKQQTIEYQNNLIKVLKDILIKQGTRIVTEAQAKKLNL